MDLSEKQTALCDENQTDFSDLRTVFFNCTLKHPDQASHTSLLIGTSAEIMRKSGVTVEDIRMTVLLAPSHGLLANHCRSAGVRPLVDGLQPHDVHQAANAVSSG